MQPRWQVDPLPDFVRARPRLFGIAARILRSADEAEDVVQDVWLRWQAVDRSVVLDPPAFLATTTARLAINVTLSARARRETHLERGLAETVDPGCDPQQGAVREEALEFAVVRLLEKLTPAERAAYVLREAFDYAYRRIAAVLQVEEANARQLVTRARQHVAAGRCTPVRRAEQRRLLEAFVVAARSGDLAALEGELAWDVAKGDAAARGIYRVRWTMGAGPSGAMTRRNRAMVA